MRGVFDIHAHILPGIDDGAKNMEESEAMLRLAFDQGISKIIATPHYRKGQDLQNLLEAGRILQEKAYEIHNQYQILLGQEIFYFEELTDELRKKSVLTMCKSRYLLIEFDPFVSYTMLLQSLRKVIFARYIPILAHMERYICLREGERVKELIRSGCMLQMNYSSIIGNWYFRDIHWCRNQISQGHVHMMGTDMHRPYEQRAKINKALDWLRKNCSTERYEQLTGGTAELILIERNEYMGAEYDKKK